MKKTVKTVLTVAGIMLMISTVGCEVKYGGNFFPAMLCRITGKRNTVKLEQYIPVKDWKTKSVDELYEMEKSIADDALMLINSGHTLKEEYVPKVSEYKSSELFMNDCMKSSYEQLSMQVLKNCEERLYVSSAYRTREEQEETYEQDSKTAAKAGESEHEAGLAVDVYIQFFAGKAFIKSQAGRYVANNAHKFGFIVRYPMGKEDITGIPYEPWHIRYVGIPHSEIMYHNELTFEEYIEKLEVGKIYQVEIGDRTYFLQRGEADDIKIPDSGYSEIHVSPDNTGCYIVTLTCT